MSQLPSELDVEKMVAAALGAAATTTRTLPQAAAAGNGTSPGAADGKSFSMSAEPSAAGDPTGAFCKHATLHLQLPKMAAWRPSWEVACQDARKAASNIFATVGTPRNQEVCSMHRPGTCCFQCPGTGCIDHLRLHVAFAQAVRGLQSA